MMWQTGVQMLMAKHNKITKPVDSDGKKGPKGYTQAQAAKKANEQYAKINAEKMAKLREDIVDSIRLGNSSVEQICSYFGFKGSHIRAQLRILRKEGKVFHTKGASGKFYWSANGS